MDGRSSNPWKSIHRSGRKDPVAGSDPQKMQRNRSGFRQRLPSFHEDGLNALKVPIKWSMTEPEKGSYDFSYVDHAKNLAEKHHLKLVLDWFGHYRQRERHDLCKLDWQSICVNVHCEG